MKVGSEPGFSIVGAELKTWFRPMDVPRDRQAMGVIGAIHRGRRN